MMSDINRLVAKVFNTIYGVDSVRINSFYCKVIRGF